MSECACQGSGVVLAEGPCDAAPVEAPCKCLALLRPSPNPVRAAAHNMLDWVGRLELDGNVYEIPRPEHMQALRAALAAEQEPKRMEITDEMAKVVRVLDKAYHPQMGENRMHPLDVLVKAGAITSEQCQAALSSEAQEDQS